MMQLDGDDSWWCELGIEIEELEHEDDTAVGNGNLS